MFIMSHKLNFMTSHILFSKNQYDVTLINFHFFSVCRCTYTSWHCRGSSNSNLTSSRGCRKPIPYRSGKFLRYYPPASKASMGVANLTEIKICSLTFMVALEPWCLLVLLGVLIFARRINKKLMLGVVDIIEYWLK